MISDIRCYSCGRLLAVSPKKVPRVFCDDDCAEIPYTRMDRERMEVLVELICSGASIAQTAQATGVAEINVTWALRGRGLLPRFRDRLAEQRKLEAFAANGSVRRPRGRPRLDGLVPGSPEAKEADLVKKREAAAARRRAQIVVDREAMRRHREERLRILNG